MKGKVIVAGTHTLMAEWEGSHLTVKEGTTLLYDGIVFQDIIDFEDVDINDAGNANFVVRVVTKTTVASDFSPENNEPKMKYPYSTLVQVLQFRSIAGLVSFS